MQHLEVSGAVRPLKWPLGVKWLKASSKLHLGRKKGSEDVFNYNTVRIPKIRGQRFFLFSIVIGRWLIENVSVIKLF